MKRFSIVFTDEAIKDIQDSVDFYNRIEKELGAYFYKTLVMDIEKLKKSGGFHKRWQTDYYRFTCSIFPFFVYYTLESTTELVIHAILSWKQHPDKHMNRF